MKTPEEMKEMAELKIGGKDFGLLTKEEQFFTYSVRDLADALISLREEVNNIRFRPSNEC